MDQILASVYPFYTFMLAWICWKRRYQKKYELYQHVRVILDKRGCGYADQHFLASRHITRHYRIPLINAGFIGDIEDLRTRALLSLRNNMRQHEVFFMVVRSARPEIEPQHIGLIADFESRIASLAKA